MPGKKQPAFMSYAREDAEFALRLAKDLKSNGASVWLDQLDIRPGRQWDSEIESALGSCSEVLLVLSPASVASRNVMDEIGYALDEGKIVVPALYEECKIPLRLRRVQYIDFRSDYDAGVEALIATFASDSSEPAPKRPRESRVEPGRTAAAAKPQRITEEPAPPPPPPVSTPMQIAGILPGQWRIDIQGPNGMSQFFVTFYPNWSFDGMLTVYGGQSRVMGQWQIGPVGQLIMQGQMTVGWNAMPYAVMVQFDSCESTRASGYTTGGERVVWTRIA